MVIGRRLLSAKDPSLNAAFMRGVDNNSPCRNNNPLKDSHYVNLVKVVKVNTKILHFFIIIMNNFVIPFFIFYPLIHFLINIV